MEIGAYKITILCFCGRNYEEKLMVTMKQPSQCMFLFGDFSDKGVEFSAEIAQTMVNLPTKITQNFTKIE